ncbi:MAG: polyketide-type polyunsaturated fatty acid synthase PfaA [Bacteroidetes bacterium]|nr:MAG: polyketide-type polyunsaturated fatty acid synthase PfaA [Bacteroidota bacterium]
MNLNSSLQKTPIAVIGMSAIFADARNLEEFWTNIIQSKDSIKEVPANRWLIEDYYDEDMFAPDKTYCKRGGFLPEIDFNPLEFGLPPNILEVTDASQLLGLVAARDALADAGYGQDAAKFTKALKEKTGVLLGVGGGQKLITPLIARLQYPIWERALRASGISETDIPRIVDKMKKAYVSWNENAFPGLLGNVISGRITNRFDLGGINSVVDAACAASLSAIKMSLSELVEGRCDMMLTGGVDTDNSPFMFMSFSKTPAFSKSGNISPFSDAADGMLIGEGLGMLVLKRLADAERDGDQIYAVVKGVGTSSDGRFKSVYAPRPAGQALAMSRAYEDAGYAPATVGLLEGHGTGTGAGDPTEFTSMQMVFGADNPRKQSIALGSVKSQIGHTKAAAGAAGIIKMVLALHHKVLPATINVEKPNHKFDIEESAMYINTETRPWLRNGHPRRAGVSAFGFGGINVHLTMEEYLGPQAQAYRLHEPYKTVLLQAASVAELQQACRVAQAQMQGAEPDDAFVALAQAAKNITLNPAQPRLGFVAENWEEAVALLQIAVDNLATNANAWNHPKGIYFRSSGVNLAEQKVVALFSGQGSQYVGMGKELANAFPEVAQTFAQTDTLFQASGEAPLSEQVFPIPVFSKEEKLAQQRTLTQTQLAQPAIGTLSMGQYRVLQRAGFKAQLTAGHSFGELTALWAAGAYDDATFLALAKARGAAMTTANPGADTGSMLAVKAPEAQVAQAIANLPGVVIANVNSNDQVVLGGSTPAIKAAEEQLGAQGFAVVPLSVAAAFHTSFVGHAQQPFSSVVQQQQFNSPQLPVYANTTGEVYPVAVPALKTLLANQLLQPVLFKKQIENIYRDGGRIFVEFGPKGILTHLVENILKDQEHVAVALNPNARKDSDLQFRQGVVQLQVLGLPLANLDPYKKMMVPLPPKSKLTVKLSGNNFVSATTQQAYEEVMTDGFQVAGGSPRVVEKIVTVEKIVEVPVTNGVQVHTTNEEEMMNKEALQLLQATIESFQTNQTKSLEIFERFLQEQNQQSQQLLQILAQQMPGAAPVPAAKPNPLVSNGAPSVPEMPLYTNGNNGRNGKATAAATLTVPAPATAAPAAGSGLDLNKLTAMLLTVVSEKTGYPAEMLDLSMDMEADLGIDSIKRVEIFGALTQQYPAISGINPNELTELRTLAEIVSYVGGKGGATAAKATAPAAVQPTPAPAVAATPAPVAAAPAPTTTGLDLTELTAKLLAVVSEKTGYPAEMLDLSMDMEADLGIDSIKRVEIFGALTQQYPAISGINPNELTELRTLAEIVSYVGGKGGATAAKATAPAAVQPTPAPAVAATPAPVAAAPAPTTTGLDLTELTAKLLAVVSEKTGYPAEMLDLSMDMEADLGIDSIKRVEIFGALTQQYPAISGINPNELTELRTLAEIVSYVGGKGGATAAKATAPAAAQPTPAPAAVSTPAPTTTGLDLTELTAKLLAVVSEKTGYPAEMLDLSMDMEADLGIDSIKRVEIFGALTQQYPAISGINPNELTELRTLAEIVSYVGGKGGATAAKATAPAAAQPTPAPAAVSTPAPTTTGLDLTELTAKLLAVVSEKTGYPAEMLDLSMDMEADLGIDSIKRVEIFGALTQQYPAMSGINPNELTELRTLAEIVNYVDQHSKKKMLAQ